MGHTVISCKIKEDTFSSHSLSLVNFLSLDCGLQLIN